MERRSRGDDDDDDDGVMMMMVVDKEKLVHRHFFLLVFCGRQSSVRNWGRRASELIEQKSNTSESKDERAK
jgi:hypothetical protein